MPFRRSHRHSGLYFDPCLFGALALSAACEPVVSTVDRDEAADADEEAVETADSATEPGERPVFTPFTEAPEIQNVAWSTSVSTT